MLFVWQLRTVLDEGENSRECALDASPCFSSSSEFSEAIQFSTLGTIPSEPDPPMLSERGVKHLTLSWIKRPTDETFTLQMADESNYFRNKYSGSALTCVVTELYRDTEYKFRVGVAEMRR